MGYFVSCKSKVSRLFIAIVWACFALNCVSQQLPEDEVLALQRISSVLQNTYWVNISRTSCVEATAFNSRVPGGLSNVTCDCSFVNNTCHVTNIQLRGLNLTGSLPLEFRNLTFLQEIDISQNFINGSIPAEWEQLPLVSFSAVSNRLTGTIPPEIGNISTLERMDLRDNLFEGNLPPSLGSLSRLQRLMLSGNNFNGTIPETFVNLRNLTHFMIDGTSISGRIPDLIGNWTSLTRLDMQGTSMEGPIPDSISQLGNLRELRISDLNATGISFPNLSNLENLQYLILRNCSITGTIPEYLGVAPLFILDLSFNMLSGEIPASLQQMQPTINYLFLAHNSLTGAVPAWIPDSGQRMDLSYNNFTETCQDSCASFNINLAASHSSAVNTSSSWCFQQGFPCPRSSNVSADHTFFINCGGLETNFEGNNYEVNDQPDGPSHFESNGRWGYSSSGFFDGNDRARFITGQSTNPDIYQSERIAASSLKYYGFCMRSGNYRVRLHFAEIVFSNDSTFSSVGRRMFDVTIQGQVVLSNFDIAREASGTGIGIIREFNIDVNSSTLEIHLFWTGKGTITTPFVRGTSRGLYGPLISAIAVTPNFDVSTPDFDVSTPGLSVGAIVGIVVSSFVAVVLILLVLWWKGCFGGKYEEDKELRALDLQTGYFSLRQIKHATNNFDVANKIGEGGFGSVYKGVLSDGTIIAVKQLSAKSKQGNREFVTEIGMISALQHHNLVKLYGCCIEGNQMLLIYEYLENNSLARALFGKPEQRLNLDWTVRNKICIGIAKGLTYLHEESMLKIVHRDIKATNVLLDKDLTAKISDFGLAKLDEGENTHISTRIAGTIGYMAPEYAMRGYLTDKADVYSFGIVALEIVSGKSNTNYMPKEEFVYLLDWAYVLQEQGSLLELVDPTLGSDYSKIEAMRMLNISLLCANPSPTLRPSMSAVVSMLEGKIPVQALIVRRTGDGNEQMRFKAFEILSQDSQTMVSTFYKDGRDGPWVDSTVSAGSIAEETLDHSSSCHILSGS